MKKREKCWKLFLINILILTLSFSFISASTSLASINVNPSITNSNPVLTVTLSESNSSYLISGAEYFIDSAGVSGTGNSLTASDGAYDELTEDASASIDITGLSQGSHTVYVHGLNNNSEWGAFSTISFTKDTIIPTLTSMQITGAYGATNRLSPQNADGKYDSVRIIMNSSESVDWGRTRIYNSTGQEIKYFNGPAGLINSNIETWDGKNSSGNYVLDGTYTIFTNITDQAGNSNVIYIGSVLIDNTAPIGTITRGTPIASYNDLTQEITINYNEVMDTSYRPLINFTNNIGEIRSTGGSWSTNQIWTENFLVEDADEETTNVIISSSLAKDLVENSEGTSISASFSIIISFSSNVSISIFSLPKSLLSFCKIIKSS